MESSKTRAQESVASRRGMNDLQIENPSTLWNLPFLRWLVVINGMVPLLVLASDGLRNQLGANAVSNALHTTGKLSLLFLLLSLCMTPLRWISGWGGWISFRRALGLYGFLYAIVHFAIYFSLDREGNLASTIQEMSQRRFLWIGAMGLLLMVPLALTSTQTMIHRLGPRNWKRLHRLAYLIAALGVLHYTMSVKSDVSIPILYGTVLAGLLLTRVGHSYWFSERKSRLPTHKERQPMPGAKRRFWQGALRVVSVDDETPSVKTFRLVSLDGSDLPFTFEAGQYLSLEVQVGGELLRRRYTISSSPNETQYCEITVKREPLGRVSAYLHDHVAPDDVLQVWAPAGRFVFDRNTSDGVVLLGAGVGITPLMSILRDLCDCKWGGTVYFLYVTKTFDEIIFRRELERIEDRFPNLRLVISLTQSSRNHGAPGTWDGERGRFDQEKLSRYLPGERNTPVYLCGPEQMMRETIASLIDLGVASDNIHQETFYSGPLEEASRAVDVSSHSNLNGMTSVPIDGRGAVATARDCTIQFEKTNIQVDTPSHYSVLDAAESVNVDIPFDCRSGICGQCRVRLLQGRVQMKCRDALSATDAREGWILACQSFPNTNCIVDA